MKRPIETISSKIAWACRWYRVRQDEILLPDGTHGQYNVVDVAPSVFIVPQTASREIVLIHSYRYTLDNWVWELPAGSVEVGQTIEACARKELLEETGGRSDHWRLLGSVSTANGISNEIAHLWLASGVVLGQNQLEAAEVLSVHPTPVAKALAMARSNQIQDGPSALALLLAEPYLDR